MLYIHELRQLTPKSAEMESVYLLRELLTRTAFPLQVEKIQNEFSEFHVSLTEQKVVEQGLQVIEPTIDKINMLIVGQNKIHELINLQRTKQILTELIAPLRNNLAFINKVSSEQEGFPQELTMILNRIPSLKSIEEKKKYNQQLKNVFSRILRSNDFVFNYRDVIYEAQINHITGLSEGMAKGFLFHVSLEEELKKISYGTIKQRLPPENVEEIELLGAEIETIKKAVDVCYTVNMRMIQWSLLMYTYVKMVMQSK